MAISQEDNKDITRKLGKPVAKAVKSAALDKAKKVIAPAKGEKYIDWSKHKPVKYKSTPKSSKSFTDRLESHKAKGASFDNGTWKPAYKGQSFRQAIEDHKGEKEFD